jgi:predicted esterase
MPVQIGKRDARVRATTVTMLDAVRHCTFSARLDCHYLLRIPDSLNSKSLLALALHGFGSTAEVMLRLTAPLFSARAVVASLQGPNQFFLDAKSLEVGYGWNTNRHTASSIRLHHEMVQHVLNEAGREYGIPPERRLLVGFSQPVALNYRFAATFPDAVRGVIALCGGLPGDWETASYLPVQASLLHIARRQDDYYPPAVTEQYLTRLRARASDVEFHLIEGGHRVPSGGGALVAPWLKRIFGS